MIKKILFVTALASASALMAQNIELKDASNNNIGGGTYWIYDNATNLGATKFHVGNNSGTAITFDARVYELHNGPNSDLQVCFGTACYIANAGVSAAQNYSDVAAVAPAGGVYNDFKVAPFSGQWATGNFAKWRLVVVDVANPTDTSTACVVWSEGGTFAGDQNGNKIVDGSEIAGDVDLNGIIDGNELAGDMNGSGWIDVCEISGDANGNGKIDNGEVASTGELAKGDVGFDVYPNPVADNLTIRYAVEGANSPAVVEVYDVLGQIMISRTVNSRKGQINLNVTELNAGVYFCSIKVDDKAVKTKRVIVK